MPRYSVTVTASYDSTHAPARTAERLEKWVGAADGRTFVIDDSIAPVRWTATVDYQVESESPQTARDEAVERYSEESAAAGIVPAETVLAATGPLNP
jgi:hypothetical protein